MQRRSSRQVSVAGAAIGGGAPMTIQSMTNTDTRDVQATAAQILALEAAGCEIVRCSVYDMDCAEAIPDIKANIHIPLVADIHFDVRLAIAAIEHGADKLRFNPGNIGGETQVKRLAACASMHHVPIRIGVNSGSVEPALLQKYGGPTPEAMVESALTHAALLEREGFYDTVLSLKASNVPDTVAAYRQAAQRTDYPLHIGVTEAGAGSDAAIKSAVGLGALLLEGIGDTLRVSITGDPVQEVYAAQAILQAAGIRRFGVEVVSCPTCGRTGVDLLSAVTEVKARLAHIKQPLTVAVMGCAVNGPGEAREADVGIAFGSGSGVLFEKGEQKASGTARDMIELLVAAAERLAAQA